MRKVFAVALMLLVLFTLSACRGSSNPAHSTEDPIIETEREKDGGSLETGDGFGFTYLQLSIDVDEEEIVHIRYDVENTADATYVDRSRNVDVSDTQAMNETGALFKNVRVQKGVSAEQMMEEIITFFRLEQFSTFDLLVRFDDGTELRINESGTT